MLKHFAINSSRDILVPDFECYQMDLGAPVEAAIDAGEVSDDFRELPSWTKFASHPIKSKGFFVRVVRNLFLGEGTTSSMLTCKLKHIWIEKTVASAEWP